MCYWFLTAALLDRSAKSIWRSCAKYWHKNNLPFVGLPDPKHSVLKLYGQEIKLFKFGRMPAMVIIDMQGIVRFVHYGHSMSDIPENAEVLETIRALQASD